MTDHILFLTGRLAEKRLRRVLDAMGPAGFSHETRNIGVSVAALMTAKMLRRRLNALAGVDKIIVPGLCRGNLDEVAGELGIPVLRGPVDVKDLPVFFGLEGQSISLDKHKVRIFAEIVDAPMIGMDEILARAARYKRDGADVIDLGCLPDTPFPHLEDAVRTLHDAGYMVSVDSMEQDELLRGGKAGADYLLSLKESSAWIAEATSSVPIIIPDQPAEVSSLYRLVEKFKGEGRPFIADSILDPIHFGFTASLIRYHDLRKRFPDVDIMMGVGNLTELTEADTSGINAVLCGIISELDITNILATEVSPHACSAVREADKARRIMYAAKQEEGLPKGIDGSLLTTHARKPFPYSFAEVAELAGQIKDPSYRIEITEGGIHVFNRDGLVTGRDPYELFPRLDLLEDDAPHAFYMGVELAKAGIARQLAKRYVQDENLDWGAATVPEPVEDPELRSKAAHDLRNLNAGADPEHDPGDNPPEYKPEGATLLAKKKKQRSR